MIKLGDLTATANLFSTDLLHGAILGRVRSNDRVIHACRRPKSCPSGVFGFYLAENKALFKRPIQHLKQLVKTTRRKRIHNQQVGIENAKRVPDKVLRQPTVLKFVESRRFGDCLAGNLKGCKASIGKHVAGVTGRQEHNFRHNAVEQSHVAPQPLAHGEQSRHVAKASAVDRVANDSLRFTHTVPTG